MAVFYRHFFLCSKNILMRKIVLNIKIYMNVKKIVSLKYIQVYRTAFEICNYFASLVLTVSQVVGINQSSKKIAFYLFFWWLGK